MIHSVRLKRFVLRKRAYHISKCLSCKQLELLKIQYLGWVLIQNYCKAHLVSWLFKERIERKRSCFSDDRLKQCARHSIRTTRAARVTRLMRWWRWVPPYTSAAWRRGAASKSAARRRGVGGALNCAFVQCSFAFQSPFHCSFSSLESVQKVTVIVYIFYTIRKVFSTI